MPANSPELSIETQHFLRGRLIAAPTFSEETPSMDVGATIGRPRTGCEFAGISDINATDPAGRETRPLHLSMWVRCKIYQASP